MSALPATTPRRGFLARLVTAAVPLAACPLVMKRGVAMGAPGSSASEPERNPVDERWMDALNGRHRIAFDVDHHRDGRPLQHASGYLDSYREDYQAAPRDVNVVLGLHGRGLGIALSDVLWSRYRLGEFYSVVDPITKAPAVRNLFTRANIVAGGPVTAATAVDVLQAQGVVVTACREAIRTAAHRLADGGRGVDGEIREALIAGVLPGVIVVPAMYITLSRLQERGVAYVYVG